MSENINRQFLTTWSILNFVGLIVGSYFVSLIQSNVGYIGFDFKFSAWKTMLIMLPLGAGIGVFQWFKLRQFGIKLFMWAFATALGFSILVTLYVWVLNFRSHDYREYNIPDWVINTGLAITIPIGGVIIGSLQSIVIRKHISRPCLWIRAYAIGFLLPLIITPLAYSIKSFILKILYISEFLYFFVDLRWLFFFGFLIIVTVVSISILTSDILLKQSNTNSVTIKAG
ncbi:MAG TPA: hypothetical protein PLT08_17670 [Anaerolineales bacterium]|nr:hypothetical protein [Anaerolineales bacterium]